ncbi:MAG: NAD(+)/NADH kinase [Lachnospiraceae bacterium]
MNRFYIVTNYIKDKNLEKTELVKNYLEMHGKSCVLSEYDQDGFIKQGTIPRDIDCAITLGGDGTLLQTARELLGLHIPLLGINMGTLGYLTEVETHSIEGAMERLVQDDFVMEHRMMLLGIFPNGEGDVALNDIVVSRTGCLRILHFNLYVNGELLNSYKADGVIISTPTGSTAYNLSAGGPIVEPTASMILITPICSHALNTSSIILSAEDEIIIEIGKGRDNCDDVAAVTFDGTDMITIRTGERIAIKKSTVTTQLVKLSNSSFLETLRDKMKGN